MNLLASVSSLRLVATPSTVTIKRILLPAEHGSWALTFEPLLLGLLVVPSVPGAWLVLVVAAAFLLRKPAKLAWGLTASREACVRAAAEKAALLLGAVAMASLWFAGHSGGWLPLVTLLCGIPGVAFFFWCDRTGRVRTLPAEAVGTLLCSLPLIAMALAARWTFPAALALGSLSLARSLPTLVLVRTTLRRAKDENVSIAPALLIQIVALLTQIVFAFLKCLPAGTILVGVVLAARSAIYLALGNRCPSAKRIGMAETGVGLAYLMALSVTFS